MSFQWVKSSFWICFWSGFGMFSMISFLVPFALYLQQFGTRKCHDVEWYLLHFAMVTFLHGICHILAFQPLICMAIADILVLQTFMSVSLGLL